MKGSNLSWRSEVWLLPIGTLLAVVLLVACKKPARDIFQEGMAAYAQGDYATAMQSWRPLADAGDPSAQTNVGFLYSRGWGVPQDPAEAFKWYKMAAMQNYTDAEYNLALLYRDGKGVEVNIDEAIRWFQLAAEKGHLRATALLGDIYYKGTGGEVDIREAMKWFFVAADKGDPQSQLALGDIFAKGQGIPPDRVRAYVWYTAATMQQIDELVRARAMIARIRLTGSMDEVELVEGERQAEEWREIKRTEANR